MIRKTQAIVAICAALALASCGGDDGDPIPSDRADRLESLLQQVQRQSEAESCQTLLADTIPALEREASRLPSGVGSDTQETVEDGVAHLRELAETDCARQQEEELPPTEETTPEETTTAPTTTETTTEETTTDETTTDETTTPPEDAPPVDGGEDEEGGGGDEGSGGTPSLPNGQGGTPAPGTSPRNTQNAGAGQGKGKGKGDKNGKKRIATPMTPTGGQP